MFEKILPHLDEGQQRLLAGAVAEMLGTGESRPSRRLRGSLERPFNEARSTYGAGWLRPTASDGMAAEGNRLPWRSQVC